jgi:hypothetical protein
MTSEYTYTIISAYPSRDITSHDLVSICHALETEYGDGYKIHPEDISEGGIVFRDYPLDIDRYGYKCFRFSGNCWCQRERYPWIDRDNPFSSLLDIQPVVVINRNTECSGSATGRKATKSVRTRKNKFNFCLKAFNGAPVWTFDDLDKFKKCLEPYGIIFMKYTKKQLHTSKPQSSLSVVRRWNT